MTVETLHDALNLLPGDLVTATDKLRTLPKPKVIQWKRWLSLAACLAVLLCTALAYRTGLVSQMKNAKQESAAQAPAAAPMMPEKGIITETPAEEAAPEAPAADAAGSVSGIYDEPAAEEELCIDHSHRYAEEKERDRNAEGYCGNMTTTVWLDGVEYSFAGSESVVMTDILANLEYDGDTVCRCMTEFTVDTEMITGIEVNLTQGFARCEQGQAALTEKQAEILQEIISNLS